VTPDEIASLIQEHGATGHERGAPRLDFKEMMRFRINNILLVSSLYDFHTLVEDGQLTEAVFNEFMDLNLLYAPGITRVNSGEAALRRLDEQPFDLVITMLRLGDMDLVSFCRAVADRHPGLPVVLLAYQSRELQLLIEAGETAAFERVFIWSGDTTLFLAIIKLFEDARNAPADCLGMGVRTVILVEDSPSFYSSYLPLIYTALIRQGHTLIEEGTNAAEKLLRHRARPKILLATTYEEACEAYARYRGTVLGVITDMSFPRAEGPAEHAGIAFIRHIRATDPELPILLQTASTDRLDELALPGVDVIDKQSRMLSTELGAFIASRFGFGDFVFRTPDGREVARARTLRELRDRLRTVPDESLHFHASRDQFSDWLMARTQFTLAKRLKPVKIGQFRDLADVRAYLIGEISRQIADDQYGIIASFSRGDYDTDASFVRIGTGSLGGKARGLAFVNGMLKKYLDPGAFPGVSVSIPPTIVLGTDVFAQFVAQNDLLPVAVRNAPDEHILRAFLRADLPPTVLGDLRAILEKVQYPLAVRSSSLLEDALYQPFAGIYATVMIPNSSADFSVRFHNLTQAIKYVFASTYFQGAKSYIEATGNRVEEEKMAVIIQAMVGERRYRYFYPSFSGVARSYNYYPFGKAKPRDGVVNLALGLGKTIVDGGVNLQFSPAYPTVFPQFGTTRDYFHNSQVKFYAVDLQSDIIRKYPTEDEHLVHLGIEDAELHGTLAHIASTWSAENDALYEGVFRQGPRVINFGPILKSRVMPLVDIVRLLLGMCETAMNCPVEMEFAVRLGAREALPAEFSFLQVRPMVKQEGGPQVDLAAFAQDEVLLRSSQALGNGAISVADVVYVKPETFDAMRTRRIASELARVNAACTAQHAPYLLIGPGRWGSSDPSLGIPVKFPDISAARAIVETTLPTMVVDPSQGSHFFQNLTSFHIVYLTQRHYNSADAIDYDWLAAQETVEETEHVRRVRLPADLRILVDGQSGNGVVLKRTPRSDA
jgi:CheY-like chemotaxis protein